MDPRSSLEKIIEDWSDQAIRSALVANLYKFESLIESCGDLKSIVSKLNSPEPLRSRVLNKKLIELENKIKESEIKEDYDRYLAAFNLLQDYIVLANLFKNLNVVNDPTAKKDTTTNEDSKYYLLSKSNNGIATTTYLIKKKNLIDTLIYIDKNINNVEDYARRREELKLMPDAVIKQSSHEMFKTDLLHEIVHINTVAILAGKKEPNPWYYFDENGELAFWINNFKSYQEQKRPQSDLSIEEQIELLINRSLKQDNIQQMLENQITLLAYDAKEFRAKIKNKNLEDEDKGYDKKKDYAAASNNAEILLAEANKIAADNEIRFSRLFAKLPRLNNKPITLAQIYSKKNETNKEETKQNKKILIHALILEKLINKPVLFTEYGKAYKHPKAYLKNQIQNIQIQKNGRVKIIFKNNTYALRDIKMALLKKAEEDRKKAEEDLKKAEEIKRAEDLKLSENFNKEANITKTLLKMSETISLPLALKENLLKQAEEIKKKEELWEGELKNKINTQMVKEDLKILEDKKKLPKVTKKTIKLSIGELLQINNAIYFPELTTQFDMNNSVLDSKVLKKIKFLYKSSYRTRAINIIKKYEDISDSYSFGNANYKTVQVLDHPKLGLKIPKLVDSKKEIFDALQIAEKELEDLYQTAKIAKGNLGFIMHVQKKLQFEIQRILQAFYLKEDPDIINAFNAAIKLDIVKEFNHVLISYCKAAYIEAGELNVTEFKANLTKKLYAYLEEIVTNAEDEKTKTIDERKEDMRRHSIFTVREFNNDNDYAKKISETDDTNLVNADIFTRMMYVAEYLAKGIKNKAVTLPTETNAQEKYLGELESYKNHIYELEEKFRRKVNNIPDDLYQKAKYYQQLNHELIEMIDDFSLRLIKSFSSKESGIPESLNKQILEKFFPTPIGKEDRDENDKFFPYEKLRRILNENIPKTFTTHAERVSAATNISLLRQWVYEHVFVHQDDVSHEENLPYLKRVENLFHDSLLWINNPKNNLETDVGKEMLKLRNTCVEVLYFFNKVNEDAIQKELNDIRTEIFSDENMKYKHMTGINNMRNIFDNQNAYEPSLITLLNLQRIAIERNNKKQHKFHFIGKGRMEWADKLYKRMQDKDYLTKIGYGVSTQHLRNENVQPNSMLFK